LPDPFRQNPQFLILDFRDLSLEFRKQYSPDRPVWEQIVETEEAGNQIKEYCNYLSYEEADSFTNEEKILTTVYEIESYIRAMGIESGIGGYMPDEIRFWIDGLQEIGLKEHWTEAKRILPELEKLEKRFPTEDDWEYDDVVGAIDEVFETTLNYEKLELFDLEAVLLSFLAKNNSQFR
jgi:hypothetical protein